MKVVDDEIENLRRNCHSMEICYIYSFGISNGNLKSNIKSVIRVLIDIKFSKTYCKWKFIFNGVLYVQNDTKTV